MMSFTSIEVEKILENEEKEKNWKNIYIYIEIYFYLENFLFFMLKKFLLQNKKYLWAIA